MNRHPALGLAAAILPLLLPSCAAAPAVDDARPIAEDEVAAVLATQAEAWNRGDLEAFVATYWDDDRLTFCGRTGITRGRRDLLATYRRGYPDAAARGVLTFTLEEVRSIRPGAALVIGRYHLQRAEPADGWFTLVVERKAGRIAITHDHSSSAEPAQTATATRSGSG